MKIYIKSANELDTNNDRKIDYYNFCRDHQSDLDNQLKNEVKEHFGVTPYYAEVDLEDLKSGLGNSFTIYAELDILKEQFTSECLDHVTFDDNIEYAFIYRALSYRNGKFYAVLNHSINLPSENGNFTLPIYNFDSLDGMYDAIDSYIERVSVKSFIGDRENTIQTVQHIYDTFKNKANLEFEIEAKNSSFVRIYEKDTGKYLGGHTCTSYGDVQISDKDVQKIIGVKSNKQASKVPATKWNSLEDWYFNSDDCEKVQRDFYKAMTKNLGNAYPDAENIGGEPSVQGLQGIDIWSVTMPDGILSAKFDFEEEMEYMFENGAKDCAEYYSDRFIDDAEFEEE